MTATAMVAANTALGTDFSGLSTLSSLAQADSNPKKAQNIMGAVAVTAESTGKSRGFQFCANTCVSKLNGAAQSTKRSGIKMPQMVTALRRPMALTPAKFTSVESQSSAIVKHCTTPKSA